MLSLDDVLSIRHPESPQWSPDGARVAFAYHVDGVRELWTAPLTGTAGEPARASADGLAVAAYGWLTDGRLVYASGGRLFAAPPGAAAQDADVQVLVDGPTDIAGVACSPREVRLSVARAGGNLLILEDGPVLREPALSGKALGAGAWSRDGSRLAVPIVDGKRFDIVVIDATSGETVWRSRSGDGEGAPVFVGRDRLTFVRESPDNTWREFVLVDLASGEERVVERVESERGLSFEVAPAAAPDGRAVAYVVPVDGWPHVVVHDLERGTRTVALPGEHEDLGHEMERPSFSPDGRSVAFASSRGSLRHRQIWRYDLASGEARALTEERGTHTDPVWSPDGTAIACISAGPFHSAEVAVVAADGSATERLTRSMPAAWTREAIVEPEHVLLTSADGMKIHTDLWLPPQGPPPGERLPGLVYVHGGPTRQMRDGWHPMHAYAVFYAYNQYLVGRGYAVISVDYRGGTGYGVAYEQANYLAMGSRDMEDCITAAEHLAALPQVDGSRLAIWGLSYGGYMTLAALTKRPEVFALGINIAGLWDMQQWARWIGDRHYGAVPYFIQRLGGPLDDDGDAEAHRHASPRNFVEGLKAPLLNLHGTADANVDFAQLDEIIRDCTEHGKDFAALYYPDESHMFTKRTTWEDAFRRIESAFERYLRCEPDARPRAMI